MTAFSNRSRHRSQTPPRQVSWATGPETNSTITGVTLTLWSSGSVGQISGLTIVRTRGEAQITLTAVNQAHGGFDGAFGIGIATSAAFAAGVASLPSPITEIGWDGWLVHQMFSVASITATIADGSNAVGCSVRYEIDSKAMRKLKDEDRTIFGITEAANEFGAATMSFTAIIRMLVKLP